MKALFSVYCLLFTARYPSSVFNGRWISVNGKRMVNRNSLTVNSEVVAA